MSARDLPAPPALRRREQMPHKVLGACHGGAGDVGCRMALDAADSSAGLSFLHDDILPPGVSIGEHDHRDIEETYFVAEGSGELLFDGRRLPVGPGDVSVCGPGHTHGIVNTGAAPLRLLVIALKLKEAAHAR
ncbi:MAG TPA: cupin domain-containing protein [Planctomycetota bacterium]|nr:cupin domain-containing protein [Planctomycetota bacterium]